jgi:endonuclease YncB( thermonuclease family)
VIRLGTLCLAALLTASACSRAAEPSQVPGGAQFVASSRGEVFYALACDAWRSLEPSNLRYFRAAADAEAAGYRPSVSPGCAPQRATAPIQPTVGGTADCTIERIVDGDTLACRGGTTVRLLLVDAHERNQSEFADSATALLGQLAPPGSVVTLEFDVELHDRYGRVLAYVHRAELFVNRILARRGLAHVAVYPPNVRELDAIRAAVDSAQGERIGIWSGSAFECTPADFRAGRC